ncbi:MAG: hypothetical protein Q7P63_17570 [Verrucomicrobiota bacterium JB022]|nr:hypothetical protein [Verrucomicrobiota bacterium JB022]
MSLKKHLLIAGLAFGAALQLTAEAPAYDPAVVKEYREISAPALAWPAQALAIPITQEERELDGYPARMLVGSLPEYRLLMDLGALRTPLQFQPGGGAWSWQCTLPSYPDSRLRLAAYPVDKVARGDLLGTLFAHAKTVVTQAKDSYLVVINGPMDGKVESTTFLSNPAQFFEYGFVDTPQGGQLQRMVCDYITFNERYAFLIRVEAPAVHYEAFRTLAMGALKPLYVEYPLDCRRVTPGERAALLNEAKWLEE